MSPFWSLMGGINLPFIFPSSATTYLGLGVMLPTDKPSVMLCLQPGCWCSLQDRSHIHVYALRAFSHISSASMKTESPSLELQIPFFHWNEYLTLNWQFDYFLVHNRSSGDVLWLLSPVWSYTIHRLDASSCYKLLQEIFRPDKVLAIQGLPMQIE